MTDRIHQVASVERNSQSFKFDSHALTGSEMAMSQFTGSESDMESSKRPKIDKDGFVTPATPGICRVPAHFACNETSNMKHRNDDTAIADTVSSVNHSGTLSLIGRTAESGGPPAAMPVAEQNMDQRVGQSASIRQQSDMMPGSESSSTALSVGELLKDLGQESKMLNVHWSQTFGESESVELFCPTRLEKILEEALALEEHLKHQKERLRQRLQLLSRTLQMP